MFKKTQNLKNLKGFTVNFVQCSHVQTFFAFLWNETLWIALTYYEINFKITNLDSF